jgi:ferredoxin
VRLGKQMLLFDAETGGASFIHIDVNGKPVNRYELSAQTVVLGRQAPDINLDQTDMALSRRHLSITVKDRKIWVKDLGSANGSFLKIKNSIPLEPDDQFRVGNQLFKFSLTKEVVRRTIIFNTEVKAVRSPESEVRGRRPEVRGEKFEESNRKPEVESPKSEIRNLKSEGMVVIFKNFGKSCPFKPGQTICEIAEKNGLKLKADCRIGSCGIDPIRIISGVENMSPVGDEEQGTLEDINKLAAGKYRLACVAKPHGPVVVEILAVESIPQLKAQAP